MKKGGIGHFLTSIFWILMVLGVLLAIAQKTNIISIDNLVNTAKEKASYYAECIPSRDCGLLSIIDDIDPKELIINQNINKEGNEIDNNTDNKENGQYENIPQDNSKSPNIYIPRDTRGYRGPIKGEPYVNEAGLIKKNVAVKMLDELKILDEKDEDVENIEFISSEWKYWISGEERPCWNTREQVLSRDIKPETAIYLDKHLEPSDEANACTMGKLEFINGKRTINTENSGEWICPYSGKTITSPSELTISHIVSLEYASKHGGQGWSSEEKIKFANDLDNLLAVSEREHKSKGAKGPGKYMPNASYRCQYAKSYTNILSKYDLTLTKSDNQAIQKALRMCQY